MTFLPIVDRQLRESSRRPATYRMRSLLALAALGIWFFLLIAGNSSGIRKGMMLFIALGVLALGFCLVAGIFLTADCLSEEKREGTLGLLFLTELKGYDVVLGKLVATSLHSIYGLLAVLPLLALPLLIGGVTSGEFWRVTAVLLLTLFLTLSLGMLVSALARETRQAMSATLLLIVILSGILPLFWWIQGLVFPSTRWDFLLWCSPGYLYTRAFDYFWRFPVNAAEFWKSSLTIFILATSALFTACFYLPRAWHEKGESSERRNGASWKRRLRFGSIADRLAKHWRLNRNPFYWLSSRDQMPSLTAKIIIGFLGLIWIGCYAGCYSSSGRTREPFLVMTMFLGYGIHQVLKTLIAIEASRRLSEDRQSGALELLLVTPLPISNILSGQRRALWEIYRWPMIFTALINLCLFLLLTGRNPFHMHGDDRVIFSEMLIGGALMLPLDAFALSWVGMSMGMKKRGHNRAIYATLGRVMLPPWLAVLLFIFLGIGGTHISSGDMIGFVGFWFFGCVFLDIFQAGASHRGVLAELLRERSAFKASTFGPTTMAANLNSPNRKDLTTASLPSAESVAVRSSMQERN
jgi:ABC-type transport system involved in cytochrome c biogenesis permease component